MKKKIEIIKKMKFFRNLRELKIKLNFFKLLSYVYELLRCHNTIFNKIKNQKL